MRKFRLLMACIIVAGGITSCQKEETKNELPEEVAVQPTKAELEKLFNMGINIDNVTIEDIPSFDGTTTKHFVSGDITIPYDGLDDYAELGALEDGNKQYRTPNIVAPAFRNIRILGYTGGGAALSSKMQTALSWAVANYNALPNTLNFNLTFGTNTAAADIIVYKVNNSSGGASAGFPSSNGRPYRYVRINSGMDSFTTNVNEHVMGHEIGHCVGFRHQDWFNRQSCNYTGPLPAESPAIWIPGTPLSFYEDSIMLACFGPNEDGEFSSSDIQSLNILY
ncbi:M57 family metalloprotease [Aquimarina spongiae]|uniref:Dual-action HEIGH metallo-peptidase n=1 Tax=Aquimarina spongiae TaxID=570521 RepID=A0A1M6EGY5_9FLAO|nr:M57 family metalloprotease [Aquimarina spongiae]SHI84752.1 Dual-action HEIGH metallo-peptidase [Aquimarina spongiae]